MSRVEGALKQAARETGRDADESGQPAAGATAASLERYAPEQAAAEPAPIPMPVPVRPRHIVHAAPVAAFRSAGRDGGRLVTGHVDPVCAEQYARLAAVLHEAAATRHLKTVIVSSAVPREGKTLTAANLALTLANSYGQRVMLIDADLRHPSLHELFGVPNSAGLVDVLGAAGELPVVQVSEHLTLLPAGRTAGSPMSVFASPAMKEWLAALEGSFDWIIIDTPPIGLLPDAQVMAGHGDGVLLVIAAGTTSYKLVQRAIELIGPDRVLGTVLNRAETATIAATAYYEHYYNRSTSAGGGD